MQWTLESAVIAILLLGTFLSFYYVRHPRECYIEPIIEKLRQDMAKVDPRALALDIFPGKESYTEDKERVFICVKNEKGEYFPYNQLWEVLAHEFAHVISSVPDPDHVTKEFRDNYERIIKRGVELGIYNPNEPIKNYSYCSSS